MKGKIIFCFVMVCSLSSYARLGPGTPSAKSKAALIRLEPSSLYYFVIVPVFVVFLAILYALCYKKGKQVNAKFSLITSASTGAVLFAGLPHLYQKFYKIYVEMEVEFSDVSLFYFPFLSSGQIIYGLILIMLWLPLQPIILQMIFNRRDKPLLYSPCFICFALYILWFIVSVFSPLIVNIK